MLEDLEIFDLAAVIVCLAVLIFTHMKVYMNVLFNEHKERDPVHARKHYQLTNTVLAGYNWFLKHIEKQDAPTVTLAIQTLRNTMMVSIFIGGQSFLFAYSIIGDTESDMKTAEIIRRIILSSLSFMSFLCWANVIRLASHIGYYLSLTYDKNKGRPVLLPNPTSPPPETAHTNHPDSSGIPILHLQPVATTDTYIDDDADELNLEKNLYMIKMLFISFS